MIPALFIGIAVMFLLLACASYTIESYLKKPHRHIIEVIKREMAHEKKGAGGWASATTYLYKTTHAHMWLEIFGFAVAAIAALLEYLLATY